MGTPDKKLSDLVDRVKSWIPRKTEPSNLSRDFWMPDQSCRVCYECDAQFTIFNRRHHCRLCGRVFCAKCTANSIPAPSDEPKTGREDWERVRVCNFCFKQWGQGIVAPDDGNPVRSPGLSPSPSATSLASTKSSCTCNSSGSTVGSTAYSTGPYQHVPHVSGSSPHQSPQFDSVTAEEETITSGRITNCFVEAKDPPTDQISSSMNRSDDEDDDFGVCHPAPARGRFTQESNYYGAANGEEIDHFYGPHEMQNSGLDKESKITSLPSNFDSHDIHEMGNPREEVGVQENGDDTEEPLYDVKVADAEPVDFENNGLLWLPPEPEDEDDEREALLFDDDDDDATGEWGYLHSNSFGMGEYRNRDRSSEEHKRAMKNVVEGHFRALVAQLLQVENLPVGDYDETESWLDIITFLSWEAATLLKPDTSKGGGMDPGGYVKIKCIASGSRSESMVIKGVVCKKNVAHRRMASKIDKARFLILGGALEYQRVSNHLSSFDTLLQQEMDHLKMAVAKIDAHHPNVLLVEKSVSRHAQEYLLAKNITLVLNIKRPLLERISRCTGAQIVPSIDHLTSPKLGYCDSFHVERFFEEHGSAEQGGKKLTKTLMFFEGCPKPLGCTILLKGADGDELKKVKHVIQYGVFAAYHLALETSFLADEGASLPELPLKSPITVALPDKPSSIGSSISKIPGFTGAAAKKASGCQSVSELQYPSTGLISNRASSTDVAPINELESVHLNCSVKDPYYQNISKESEPSSIYHNSSLSPSGQYLLNPYHKEMSEYQKFEEKDSTGHTVSSWGKTAPTGNADCCDLPEAPGNDGNHFHGNEVDAYKRSSSELAHSKGNSHNGNKGTGPTKEEFPPSPSDHQSILVSLSTRCVWKGTVCERAHLLRIKYYGCSDKPLGRFLRDHLFDQNCHCPSCDMPSEAHIHCYTHRQGSLTISVKRLTEFLLPGEREGKIWMWHRCLRCPRTNGFPPATRRVVMSDAAWGLSFGKFLELSFSNHAAASRLASCGHSLHRDCLRFYGYGRMVACFRYASIDVHSVYLPPSKLEFNYCNQEWIQKEANEVFERGSRFFAEVQSALRRISDRVAGSGPEDGGIKLSTSMCQIAELDRMLHEEKEEFEELFKKALNKEIRVGQQGIDILEINKLRRQMLFHSYVWDQRLIYAASLRDKHLQDALSCSIPKPKEKSVSSPEKPVDVNVSSLPVKRLSSSESGLEKEHNLNLDQRRICSHVSEPCGGHNGRDIDADPKLWENEFCPSSTLEASAKHVLPKSGIIVRRAFSEGQFPTVENVLDSLDATSTGESNPESITPEDDAHSFSNSSLVGNPADSISGRSDLQSGTTDKAGADIPCSLNLTLSVKVPANSEKHAMGMGIPFPNFYCSHDKSSLDAQKFGIMEYGPVFVQSFRDIERESGARLLLPVGVNDTVVPVYDDEPTSVIAYALVSSDYRAQMSELERGKDGGDPSVTLPLLDSLNLLSFPSVDDTSDAFRSLGSSDESLLSLSGSRSIQAADPLFYTDLHARVSFTDDGPLGKAKYTVTCYYAKRFEALRRTCCPSELDYFRSLSRCKKWGAQGGKSNVFFAKTLDDRFIIKQVTKTELESFIKFAPDYFKYLSESITTGSPTCLAKILGIYQVSSKHFKGGKESKMDVLVMENLLFGRNVTRLYDLKGSSRSRYNPDTSGSNKVLLDQNLIEAMPTSPIFVGNKAKRLLERAVWNDTSFLASIAVMDYSLLVGVDEEKHELVLGIIDFMRQYTWDKHLETWVKTAGILGGPKNAPPTVISPQQYKKRFRKAMTAYFLMVPDQWSPPAVPNGLHSDLCEENKQCGNFND